MKLHIVMPVINCFDLTKQAYESVRANVNFNFILIDNASTDETQSWGTQQSANKGFTYIRNEEPKSVAASWNMGIEHAFDDPECQYVAILNNDIILHPKTLNHLMAFMDKTSYMIVTGDNIKERMSADVMRQMELPEAYTDFDCNDISDWRAEGPDFSCFLITRDTIKYIGWFDEHFEGAYCEDWDYHARINRAWRWAQQYGEPPEKRMHAKRLSTAPYFHFASQTIKYNITLRSPISQKHSQNQGYYLLKWGGSHENVMDGGGNIQPFGDARLNWTHCKQAAP